MMTERESVLIVGVGGQGVLLASDVLASVCLRVGRDVKKSDVHGMAQRGGMVFSHVRFGSQVFSPLIEEGQADALLALEWAEAVRWLPYVHPRGAVIVDATRIVPPAACADRRTWRTAYPRMDPARMHAQGRDVYLVDGRTLAKAAGVAKAANIVLLGVLSTRLPFADEMWAEAIRASVPAGSGEANVKAFQSGQRITPGVPPAAAPEHASLLATTERRAYRVDVLEAWCKGCDICVRVCPEDCLRLNEDAVVQCIAPEICTGCRLCELLCPDFAITVAEVGVAAHG